MSIKSKILIAFLLCISALLLPAEMVLVSNGVPAGAICIGKDALPGEKTAAEELQTYLGKISGASFSIRRNRTDGCIVLGTINTPGIPPEIKSALANKKSEAYYLKTAGQTLYIIGKTQVGTLYGVYGLLSDHLQVAWFNPSEEYVPDMKNIVLPELDCCEEPHFLWRTVSQTSAGGLAVQGKVWAARNRLQCASGALHDPHRKDFFAARNADHTIDSGGHLAFYNAVPPQKYLATHPEYFALVNNKRLQNKAHHNTHHCLSNPQVQKLTAEHIIALHRQHGQRITYLFGAPDSEKNWCECANCRALDVEGRLDLAPRFHAVVQSVAGEVYRHCPEARLEVWAYANYRKLPENFKIDPRMSVYFCTHGRCYAHRIDDENCPRNVEIYSLLKAWLALNPKSMHLYEYAYCTPMAWAPLEEVLAADLKTYRALGIAGWKEEISFADADFRNVPAFETTPGHAAHRLRYSWLYFYVAGKLTWDPDLDVNKVIAEAESKYYGAAYPAMKEFHTLRRGAWRNGNGCFGYPLGDQRTPGLLMQPDFQQKLSALLDQAEQLAAGDPVILRRIACDRQYLEIFWVKPNNQLRKQADRTLTAPQLKSAVTVDGSDADIAWTSAAWTADFLPVKNKKDFRLQPENLPVFAGILSSRNKLYFMIIAHTAQGSQTAEKVEIILDPRNNANTYYRIKVDMQGKVEARELSGKKSTPLPGVTAAVKKHAAGYSVELAVSTDAIDGVFAPGALWRVNIIRHTQGGRLALDGNLNRKCYRTLMIDRQRLVNGDFTGVDPKSGKLKSWNLNKASLTQKSGRNFLQLAPHGSCNQLIWDWKGLLGQSEKARKITIHVRAAGSGILQITAPTYHDDWSNGKLTRKYFASEKVGEVQLSKKFTTCSFTHTIAPDRWIALTCYAPQGAVIESIFITQEFAPVPVQ